MNRRPRSTRRDFLVGKAALDALAELPERLAPAEPSGSPAATGRVDRPTYLVQVARRAMACQFEVCLNADQESAGTDAALEALDRVEELEDQLTVYRVTSEVSRLNVLAAERPVPVEQGLFDLLQQAVTLFIETGGAFDITAGPLSRLWGFQRREGRLPAAAEIEDTLKQVGSDGLVLDADACSVQFARPGLEINLGGIGKGFALDQAAQLLTDHGVEDFLFHGGQSSVLARGRRRGATPETGWRIALRHPLRHEVRLAELTLRGRALGTSGSGNQFFHFGGKRYGHVLDPRTGQPAEGLLSATVLAPTATLADALATAFFVMGVEATEAYLAQHPELAVILVEAGREPGGLGVHVWGLEPADWKPLIELRD